MSDISDNDIPIDAPSPNTEASIQQAETQPEIAEKNPLEVLAAENIDLKDRLLRALAEIENVRRRGEREREDTAKFSTAKFALPLLAVADNLRRALEAVPPEGRNHDLLAKLLEGIEATERALLDAFTKAGIKPIDVADQKFDPNFHEVMMEIDHPEKSAGSIVQLYETGYTIHDRLLRPARVAVAKGTTARDRVDTSA